MTLSDPTGGVGYAYGERLPSTHMTTLTGQQPNALDGTNGGTYTLGSNLVINGAGEVRPATLRITTGKTVAIDTGATATLGTTLSLGSGGGITANTGNTVSFETGSTLSLKSGSTTTSAGTLTFSGTTLPALASRSYSYAQPLGGSAYDVTEWSINPTYGTLGNAYAYYQLTAGPHPISIPLSHLPSSGSITAVRMLVDGNAGGFGSHVDAIGTPPVLYLYARNTSTGVVSSINESDGAAAAPATYDVVHTIVLDGTTTSPSTLTGGGVISSTYEYGVVLLGEAGANAEANSLGILSLVVDVTVTEIKP